MIRTQIQLTEKQSKILKLLAAKKHSSIAELIRQGINYYIKSYLAFTPEERRKRALNIAGKFHSGKNDLSEQHDVYLARHYGS